MSCWCALALAAVLLTTVSGRADDRDDAIKALRAKGWSVVTQKTVVTDIASPNAKEKWATAEDVASLKVFPEVRELRLYGEGVTDDSLAVLEKMNELRGLTLSCPKVTDAAVDHFKQMTELTTLSLHSSGITAEGVKRLPTMDKVVNLSLGGEYFTAPMVAQVPVKFPNAAKLDFNHPNKLKDPDLAPLAEMKHAEMLVLGGAVGLGDGIAKTIAQMKSLHRLNVGHVSRFSDKGLEEIKALPELEMIQLGSVGVTDAGMAHLAAIKSLKEISIGDPCPITAAGIASLVDLPKLTHLALQAPGITDEAMASVVKMPALEELDLVSSGFTDAALAQLKNVRHLKKLKLGEFYRQPKITDAGLKPLAELKDLELLLISRNCKEITDAGVSELKTALPKLKLYR
jgi:hypothetical protein